MVRKALIASACCAYIAVGFASAIAMMSAIPAMNILGGTYVGIMWPALMCCEAMPPQWMSRHMFTFETADRSQPYE